MIELPKDLGLGGLDLRSSAGEVRALIGAVRPVERMSPSQWAEEYVWISPDSGSERPGRWDPDYFPHAAPIMDSVQEAYEGGYEGLALMKSGQGAGSTSMINCLGWFRTFIRGNLLYLISDDKKAGEFSRTRLDYMIEKAEPLRELSLSGYGTGAGVHIKRFATGKIAIWGGRSVNKVESEAYPIVFVDEIDSLPAEYHGKGDLVENILARGKAFRSPTLVIAFAHPTTTEKGAGALYYKRSDQRRGFVDCPHGCGGRYWHGWEEGRHEGSAFVKVFPEDGETFARASRRPDRYALVAPCCGAIVSDRQRWRSIHSLRQESTLPAEEAARKKWLGIHFSELDYPHRTLEEVAEGYVRGLDDEGVLRTWWNKTAGDVFEPKASKTDPDQWRALIRLPRRLDDPEAYTLGSVPPAVRFLTAGQDSRSTELHWSVWGWGLVQNAAEALEFVAWLIDVGVVPIPYTPAIEAADLAVFDQLLLNRTWPRTDGNGSLGLERAYFDIGWCPLAVQEYVRTRDRAFGVRGANVGEDSKEPPHRWGAALSYLDPAGERVTDPHQRIATLNTFKLKRQWIGRVGQEFERPAPQDPLTRIVLPQGVPDAVLEQLASEYLARDKSGKHWVWKHKGPNHWSDTALYAYGGALDLSPAQQGKTREEIVKQAEAAAARARRPRAKPKRRKGPRLGGAGPIRSSY